jgi:hypothetical protein
MRELDDLQIYLGKDFVVNDKITVKQTTLKDIISVGEREYFTMVNALVTIPSDCKSMLDDIGIDWMELSDFEFFSMMATGLKQEQTAPILGELDLTKFKPFKNKDGDLVLYDEQRDILIDYHIHHLISDFICRCHMITPKVEHAGNAYTKQYLIEEDRKRRKNAASTTIETQSSLQPLISSLVNSPEFKYDIEGIQNLTLLQIRDSVNRISVIRESDVLTNGLYANGVDRDKLNKKLLDWTRRLK